MTDKPSSNPLDQVIELINRTGDNCIVLDASGKPAYVVSRFDKYRKNALNNQGIIQSDEGEINEVIPEAQGRRPDPFEQNNSLNYAKKDEPVDNSDQKYYFEPID